MIREVDELSVKSRAPIEFLESPPESDTVTAYHRRCFKHYITLIDANASGIEWDEAYQRAFGREVGEDGEKARRQYLSHLARARWMLTVRYSLLP